MTVFENFHIKNLDELVEWLDKNGAYDGNPWGKWFNKTYCRKCKAVVFESVTDCYGDYWEGEHEFSWCEIYGKCRYFENMKKVPDRKQTIKLWLESEV